ncbi:MAG: N-acetylmannosamine-6-phosphate 2-epimerase, partial [Anaerolineae bacterium]|nr:N-acetylmannosamine-6-phosphate 2-epimerase [Candidatus Roseilinea sp.]MDW8451147.1 N-acetylmannosamine-6-phosphate 2-epimerase [Anaerolineae bacterium]
MTLIPRGLIVSCQAAEGEPLFGAPIMAAMARAAEIGGAVAIRANGPEDIAAIRQAVRLPVIGLWKLRSPDSAVYITPHRAAAEAIARAGCDVIAVDATPRPRPGGATLDDLIPFIRNVLGKPVMADCACLEDALLAEALGADYIGTTLAGYTWPHGRPMTDGPDLAFVAELAGRLTKPIIAEGRFYLPEQVAHALALGAHAVCIGGAITRPQDITRRFVVAGVGSVNGVGGVNSVSSVSGVGSVTANDTNDT